MLLAKLILSPAEAVDGWPLPGSESGGHSAPLAFRSRAATPWVCGGPPDAGIRGF